MTLWKELKDSQWEVERELVEKTLKRCEYYRGATARVLGVSHPALLKMINRYRIKAPIIRDGPMPVRDRVKLAKRGLT